jgi:hypothetical protein
MYVVKWCRRVVDGVEGAYGMLDKGERGRAVACAVHVRQERQEKRLFSLQSFGAFLLLPRALLSVEICLEPFFFGFFLE